MQLSDHRDSVSRIKTFEDYSFDFILAAQNNQRESEDYRYLNAANCPDCSGGMVRLGSCFSCPSCGFESCSI